MSDEIKNFREAVQKFDEIQMDLEVLREQLDSNFANYKNASDISSETASKLSKILQSVNTVQINAQSIAEAAIKKADAATDAANELKIQMAKYWSVEYSKTKKNFDALLKEIDGGINEVRRDIAIKIRDAADGLELDTSELQKAIREQVGEINIQPINDAIEKVNRANQRLDNSIDAINDTEEGLRTAVKKLNGKAKEINDATNKINTINRSVSMGVSAALLVGGVVLGAGIMTFFKIDAISDYYFSQYDRRQAEMEKQLKENTEITAKLPKLYRFIQDYNIPVQFGLYNKTKTPFIAIGNPKTSDNGTIFKRVDDGILWQYVGIETTYSQIYNDKERFQLNR